MTGTEKQISWAEDVISGWKALIAGEVENARQRVEDRKNMPIEWLTANQAAQKELLAMIDKASTAKEIIDARSTRITYKMFKLAEKYYAEMRG